MRRLLSLLPVAALVVVACAGSGAPRTGSPTATTAAEATPLLVDGLVTFFAADSGDNGGGLATGDFNGDRVRDVVFSAAFADGPENSRPDSGEAYVFLGPFQVNESRDAGTGQQDFTIFGGDEGDQTGRAVTAGDFNGDGFDDIVLGAPLGDGPGGERKDSGEVHVVFGGPGLGSDTHTLDLRNFAGFSIYGRAAENFAGFSLTTADTNGDKADDMVIGAFWSGGPNSDRTQAGEVYVILGSAQKTGIVDLASSAPDMAVLGAEPYDRLGETVAAGDADGDGLADLVLPAPFASNFAGQKEAGRIYVITSPLPAQIDLAVNGASTVVYGVDAGDQLGHGAASGDVDGDGLADVLVSAVSADGIENMANLSGEAVLVGGEQAGEIDVAQGRARTIVYGANASDRLGRSAAMGDLDGDGLSEMLLGAPGGAGADESLADAGEVYVISQPSSTLIRLPEKARVYYGEQRGDGLSSSVFGHPSLLAADMNDDGRDEILVASPNGDGPSDSRADAGEARILFLKAE